MKRLIQLAVVSVVIFLGCACLAAAQDSLAAARQLYGSASYDEALAMLDRLKTSGAGASGEARAIEQYRAFCLLALGRQGDAERAMEVVIAADPSFRPDEAEVSPRVQAAFRDVRKRLIPALAQQRYLAAKSAYDRKEYQAALDQFDAVLRLMDAPDVSAQEPPLSDLRTLISGFRDLAKAAIPPPPPPKPVVPVVTAPPKPEPPRYYTSEDAGIVAPVVVEQRVPPWPPSMPTTTGASRRGVLEVLITDTGAVESVTMRQSIAKFYDDMLVNEAKRWKYKPALKDGSPVKFRKLIQINLDKGVQDDD